jgi:hypothetical protein
MISAYQYIWGKFSCSLRCVLGFFTAIFRGTLIELHRCWIEISFWVVVSCSLERAQHSGETCRLHLQGQGLRQPRNQQKQVPRKALALPTFQPWRWRDMFVWNIRLSLKYMVIQTRTLLATCLLAGFCWTYFFDPEDGGYMLLRNVGWNSTDYTTPYPRRWYSS